MSWAAIAVGAVSIGTKIYTDAHAKSKAKKALARTAVVDDAEVLRKQEEKKAAWQNAYNSGMLPGQAYRSQEILDQAANTGEQFQQGATSASQAMKAYGGLQGWTDDAQRKFFAQMGEQKMGLLGGLSGATTDEANEYLRQYNDNQALRGALGQTIYDSGQNIGNTAGEIGGIATSIGLNKLQNRTGKVKTPPVDANVPAGWKPDSGSAVESNKFQSRWVWVVDPVTKKRTLKLQ